MLPSNNPESNPEVKPDPDLPNNESETEDNIDNLIFNSKLIIDADKFKHKESIDSVHFKYSIDITNAPKNRLQTYLTSDLLDELDKEHPESSQDDNNNNNNNYPSTSAPIITQNKFDQIKPIPKKKKPFEIREGDWTCFDCHNLNFSFRVLCNRCGLSKEISAQKCKDFQCSIYSNLMGPSYTHNNDDVNYYTNNQK